MNEEDVSETGLFSLLIASDDNRIVYDLRNAGMDIQHVHNGFDAIRMALETRYDAVILGELSKGLPSPTVAVWLKVNPLTHSIPLVGIDEEFSRWQEAQLDAYVPPNSAVAELIDIVSKAVSGSRESAPFNGDKTDSDPLNITLDLIEIYRERLSLASAMIELASLQHGLVDYEYTIKSILQTAGNALDSPLIGITLVRESTFYAFVRGDNLGKCNAQQLEEYSLREVSQFLKKPFEINAQLIFGRQKLGKTEECEPEPLRFIGHPIYSRGEILGFLAAIAPEYYSGANFSESLLPDLASQIALLLANADLIKAHESYVEELSDILRAVAETSSVSPFSDVTSKSFLLQFMLIILELCCTDRGCVILLKEDKKTINEVAVLGCSESEILSGHYEDRGSFLEAFLSLAPGEILNDNGKNDGLRTTRLIIPMHAGNIIMGGLVVLGVPNNISPRLIESIRTLSSLAGNFLYNRTLYHKSVDAKVVADQLKIAREIQLEMLPAAHPDFPGYDIHGVSEPAKEVGGDYFDYIESDCARGIVIADVCGKSIPASLLMTMTRALVVAAIENACGPENVLFTVNKHLNKTIGNGQFVTASLLCLHDSQCSYASAGHQPLMVFRANTRAFEEINADGIALGIVDFTDYERVEFELAPNDIALMYTDGLNEAMNSERVQFGYANIQRVIVENAGKSAREINDALFEAIRNHADGADQSDDTTIIIIKKL